ncbi:MAG: hypothetical protein ABI624_06610 [Casimicrobiaceae bacterium]
MNPKPSLAERAAAIARQARGYEESRGSAKPANEPMAIEPGQPGPQPVRSRWSVHLWGGTVLIVIPPTPMTQRQMRTLYPDAGGIIPADG